MTQGNSALYSPHDTARLLAAQTYKNRYYPRSWVHVAIREGFSVDDVMSLLETSCSILSRMAGDMECDYLLRVICREECEARRTYRLPSDPQKTALAVRPAAVSVFSDADAKRNSKYVGFRDLVVSNSANKIDIMRHIERVGRDIAIKEQSQRIAQRLELNNRPAYRKAPNDMIKRGLLTRLVADIPRQFNNIMFIPAVAVSARASLKKELKYWINNESDKREPLRYLVITGGQNIPFGSDLKAAYKKTCRRISGAFKRLNEKYDAKIFVRVTEHTINHKTKTLNLHSNVLYSVPHLKNGGFSMFLRDLHDELGCFIKDAGTLQKVDEVVKYVCKPSDVESLEDDDLVWLHDELKNTRLYQTYNNFQSFRSELDKTRHRVVFDSGNNKLKLMKKRVVDDSSLFTHSDTPKTKEKTFSSDVFLSTLSEPSIHADYGTKEVQHEYEKAVEENKIVGMMLPHAAFFNVSEPCLMIRNYTENPQTTIGRDALRLIEDMERGLRELVNDKLDYIGCDALSSANYDALRQFFATGNKDIDQVDSYILDTIHDISHRTERPPRPYVPPRPCGNPIVPRIRVPA